MLSEGQVAGRQRSSGAEEQLCHALSDGAITGLAHVGSGENGGFLWIKCEKWWIFSLDHFVKWWKNMDEHGGSVKNGGFHGFHGAMDSWPTNIPLYPLKALLWMSAKSCTTLDG